MSVLSCKFLPSLASGLWQMLLICHTSRWTRPLVMSQGQRERQILKLLETANHADTCWHNVTPLTRVSVVIIQLYNISVALLFCMATHE